MKKLVLAGVAILCSVALIAAEKPKSQKTLSFEEAREKIAEVIRNPEKMGEITAQLSPENQTKFMTEVNKAIVAMPGSTETKTATFLAVEREALLAAKKGNLQPMVATMFATVTLESLTILADKYGEDLFNRASDSTKTFTDEQFTEIASSTVKEVSKECEGLNDAAPRNTLAVYLFEKGSNGTIDDLEDRLLEIAISNPQDREVAKSEWLAAAKSEGVSGFSGMLADAGAGSLPSEEKISVNVPIHKDPAQALTALQEDQAQQVVNAKGETVMVQTKGEDTTGRDTASANQTAQAATDSQQVQTKTGGDVPYNPGHPGGYQYQD